MPDKNAELGHKQPDAQDFTHKCFSDSQKLLLSLSKKTNPQKSNYLMKVRQRFGRKIVCVVVNACSGEKVSKIKLPTNF